MTVFYYVAGETTIREGFQISADDTLLISIFMLFIGISSLVV